MAIQIVEKYSHWEAIIIPLFVCVLLALHGMKCVLYISRTSVKSMVFNSVYTLYYFKHIFMSVEWYLRGAGESLTAIWTLWYIWSILEIVLLLCSAFGVHFEGKHIFSLCEQSDHLFYALCFITHLIQDQYSISKTL